MLFPRSGLEEEKKHVIFSSSSHTSRNTHTLNKLEINNIITN